MSHGKLPWPIVNDAFLTALIIQVVLAVSGHFIGFLARHWGGVSVTVSALMGFIFGVWTSPTPVLTAAGGGAVVAAGSLLAGAIIMFFLRDAKVGRLLSILLIGTITGALCGAIGSQAGRSIFGS